MAVSIANVTESKPEDKHWASYWSDPWSDMPWHFKASNTWQYLFPDPKCVLQNHRAQFFRHACLALRMTGKSVKVFWCIHRNSIPIFQILKADHHWSVPQSYFLREAFL